MYLSVIIPAYNEEKRIRPTLKSVSEYLIDKQYEYEIIVVNDGSNDGTADVVRELKSEINNLKIIDYENNKGKGYAVRKGMLSASGEVSLFMDADNSTTIDNLDKMIVYINEGYDVVIASIGVKGARSIGHEPFYRRFMGKMGNLFIQLVAVSGIKDTQRGFKIFTSKAVQDIFNKAREDKWGFDIEVLAIARRLGYRIKEAPIIWNNSSDSRVSLLSYPKTLFETIKIKWNLLSNKYDK
jgi:dolichyl-phosphate beta-glucosyltransferase